VSVATFSLPAPIIRRCNKVAPRSPASCAFAAEIDVIDVVAQSAIKRPARMDVPIELAIALIPKIFAWLFAGWLSNAGWLALQFVSAKEIL
jgi:hypothetical protein